MADEKPTNRYLRSLADTCKVSFHLATPKLIRLDPHLMKI